jgi:hypothetical protein
MKRWLLAAGVLAGLALQPGAAAADGAAYTITETLVGEWHWDNGNDVLSDDYYWDIKNRLNIGILAEGIDVGMRVDTATMRFAYPAWMGSDSAEQRAERERLWYLRHGIEADSSGEYSMVGDYRLERMYAKVDIGRDWLVTGGDFYAHMGRGLILSLRKEDEMGLDSALRGGRVDGRIADLMDITLMGGLVNVTNVDERFNLVAEDPMDLIVAGKFSFDLWGSNRVSVHVMDYQPRNDEAVGTGIVGYGGTLEFLDLPYDLQAFVEVDGLYRAFDTGDDNGFGAYADLSGIFGPVQVGLEYKEYHDFDILSSGTDATGARWPYNRPPIADLEDQMIESEYDVRGGRLRMEYAVVDWLTLFAAFAGAQDLGDAHHDAVHAYGGFEILWDEGQSVARGTVGYRHAWGDNPLGGREDYRTLIHAKVDVAIHLWGPLSMQVDVLHEEWKELDPGLGTLNPYRRGTTALSLDWAGIGGVFGTFEYDTQRSDVETYYGAGGLQWFAADWLTVRGRVGSQRGGRKCLAGTCRVFPAFDGMRLEFIFRL